ncbi:MAG: sugar phosphate isomerase/epimerase [Ruminococcaceae bacterium]|nr:sugar phosphate isomerase/epimerase [Oscillospiraceae bacterium]
MDISIQTGSILYEYGFEKGAKMLREAGFDAVDWNLNRALPVNVLSSAKELHDLCIFEKPLDDVLKHFEAELKALRDNGLKISQAHAPFPAYFPGREDILDYCISIYHRVIEFCDAIGCKYVVIHGISGSISEENKPYEYYKELNLKLCRSLIPTLQKTNVTVCLENLYKSNKQIYCANDFFEGTCCDPYEAIEYIDTLNGEAGKECFGICLDIGHLHLIRKRPSVYILALGKRIKCLHLHDNDAKGDEHLMPYTGTVLWNDFLDAMNKIGYDGDLSFETFSQTRASYLPEELLPVFLETIRKTGEYFRTKIES